MKETPTIDNLQRKLEEMEIMLQKSEAQRNSIIDNNPFLAWLKDRDGKFIHVNQPYLDGFQLKREEVIGKKASDIFPYDLAQQYHQEDLKVIEQKRTINFQTKRDNEWFSTIKSPVFGLNGEVIGTTGFERNITDNIETLNSLRKERDLLQSLMDSSPDTIYFKDVKNHFVRVNKAKAEELGIENPYDAIGKSDNDFLDAERACRETADEEKVLKTGVPLISKEEKVIRKDGRESWISTTKSPIKDEKGNVVGIVGISHDISNRMEIVKKLNAERDFLQVLMDYIPYTIYFKDLQCRFTKINKAQSDLLGLNDPSEAIGKSDFDYFHEETAKPAHIDELQILSTGIPMIEKVEMINNSEGIKSWVSATKIPVKDNFGNITGLVGISIDITEKRYAEERLREAKEKAEESDRLKTAFLANMSHEIRTPMNGIIGFSNLLRNPELNNAERGEFLNHITSCGNTLLNLIDDIIDISKIEAGQIKIRIAESNINAILDEIYDSFNASKVREGKYTIQFLKHVTLPDEQSVILTDPFRLRQIISNLIGNALKFTLEGSVEFGYNLENGDTVHFYVKDTGIGIPKDKQAIIFERFGQVLDSNFFINQKGTGLGLAISNNLVLLLGGKIWVESEPNVGSVFHFSLPYNHLGHAVVKTDAGNLVTGKEVFSDKIILIAEDEEVNYLYFKQIFKNTGVTLIWVKNGLEAIEAVTNNPDISLVLMDCKMPVLDGYEATTAIKQLRPVLPVIAQTAFAMPEEQEKALYAGADAFINKPIRVKELFENLSKYLK
jgi:two-component system sensor histidine kinase/response regulator